MSPASRSGTGAAEGPDRWRRHTPARPPAATATARRVCVLGAGYVGLTAAACLAHLGHRVDCVEADPERLAQLQRGQLPIYEPGLDELVKGGRTARRLEFLSAPPAGLGGAELALLCVGTPPQRSGEPDLSQLARACRQLARAAHADLVVVVKSTVPPGSCEALELVSAEHTRPGVQVRVVSSPEFLRESRAVEDFLAPDRVVIGAEHPDVAGMVASLYPPGVPLVHCDRRGAELVKYAANAFLAMKISFANEVARLCDALGTEAGPVLTGVGMDHRIGTDFLRPGPGYGGACLPKDVAGFQAMGRALGTETLLAAATEQVNNRAREDLLAKLVRILGPLDGRRIAVLGLAFKEGTDDTRDSPGQYLAEQLVAAGADVRWYDPLAQPGRLLDRRLASCLEAADGAEAVVITTASAELRGLDPAVLAGQMAGGVVFDTVGVCHLPSWTAAGLTVYGLGRGAPVEFHPVVWSPLRWAHPPG